MNRIHLKLLLVILMVGVGLTTAYFVFAEVSSGPKITFPVAELNNCKSEAECRAYCDKPDNISVCVDFAKKNGLMSEEEANRAKQFKDVAQIAGPGGCKGQDQCETYCGDQSHIDECVSFAEKHNLMSPDDLVEAKKVSEALKQGAKLPGNCQGKKQCETYCKTSEHSEECLDFAEKAGFIAPDEVKSARKMLELVKSGDAPQECFGGKDQCQQFCSEESHRDQCAKFMVKAGFMKQEDADIFKKTGGKGPGDCQSKDECEAFCNIKENQQICFQFGKDNGLIPEEKLKQIEEGSQKMRGFVNDAPDEVKKCLQSSLGSDALQEIESGKFMPNKDTGEQMQEQMKKCFEGFAPKDIKGPSGNGDEERSNGEDFGGGRGGEGPGNQGNKEGRGQNGNSQFRGPVGCSSPEECNKFCSDPNNLNECQNFKGQNRQDQPQEQERKQEPEQEQGQPNQPFNSQMPLRSIQQGQWQNQNQNQDQQQNQQEGQQQFQGNPDSNNNFGQPPPPENGGEFVPPTDQGTSPPPSPMPSGDVSEQRSLSGIFKAMILETFKILH